MCLSSSRNSCSVVKTRRKVNYGNRRDFWMGKLVKLQNVRAAKRTGTQGGRKSPKYYSTKLIQIIQLIRSTQVCFSDCDGHHLFLCFLHPFGVSSPFTIAIDSIVVTSNHYSNLIAVHHPFLTTRYYSRIIHRNSC